MKKIVFLSLFALCLPMGMMAQSNDDDLYFVPSKDKEEPAPVKKAPAKREATTPIYTGPGTTVVVQDRKGNTRDVDEYNRRYDSRNNEFEMEDDTLYIKEKSRPDLEGEWVNGEFEGSQDDYEYAERIIRFRNPRYAISVSSPFYWDVVYGMNSWDWNVYSDGLYAYAFPTFSNRLWWDWRFNSFGGGWGFGFGSPYYGWGGYYPGYWGGGFGGWYGGGWGGHWGHHHHGGYYPGWGGGGGGGHWANSNRTYTNRRSYGLSGSSGTSRNSTTRRSESSDSRSQVRRSGSVDSNRRTSAGTTRRVVGTRSTSERTGTSSSSRVDGASTRRSTYTRPSSTRNSSSDRVNSVGSSRVNRSATPSTRSSSSYNRGSSTAPNRSYSGENTRRSYESSSSSSSSRSSSPSSSSSSRSSSSGSYSGGGSSSSSSSSSSSRSSGGGGGGGSSRSSRR